MDSDASSVTLIFYKLNNKWWEEAGLNLLAAAAQMSPYTHVEIQIGNNHAPSGQMINVARVFNDSVGVELCQRTGKNPAYSYLSLGCSAISTQRMLQFARAQVGKPFSNLAMARALFFPRKTHGQDWFCAELVAAILQQGGLLSRESNPGAATPHSLYKLYCKKAAATANPYVLRSMAARQAGYTQLSACVERPLVASCRRSSGRQNSPPRASFRLQSGGATQGAQPIRLSLKSLGARE